MAIQRKLKPGECFRLSNGDVVKNVCFKNITILVLSKEQYEREQKQTESMNGIKNESKFKPA